MGESTSELELPGFRFHPTEEELLDFYLKNMILGKKLRFDVIGVLNIYRHDPWDLPGLANIGEREWYFFVPRDRRHGSGGRPNRTTANGFWKATGSDRKILSLTDPKRMVGFKKTLVFYRGRAPRGSKTDWVMNEYRLPDTYSSSKDIVLCKIYRKATSLKVLEQMAAMEEGMKTAHALLPSSSATSPVDFSSFFSEHEDLAVSTMSNNQMIFEQEDGETLESELRKDDEARQSKGSTVASSNLKLPFGDEKLELQVPKLSIDWNQDPFCTQLHSPWLLTPYANLLNF